MISLSTMVVKVMTWSAGEVLGKIASEGGEAGSVFILTGLGGIEGAGAAKVSLLGEGRVAGLRVRQRLVHSGGVQVTDLGSDQQPGQSRYLAEALACGLPRTQH